MRKHLLIIFVISTFLFSCEDDSRSSIPRQVQYESLTFTELPKFIDIINYDDMETYTFTITPRDSRYEDLVLTEPYDLKNPSIYNSTDGLLQPLVFDMKSDLLTHTVDFKPRVFFTRPNIDNIYQANFAIPEIDYNEIYNNDLAEYFSYEYEVTYTPEDQLGRLDGTFRFTIKGKFFY